jgi:hypothetical protein
VRAKAIGPLLGAVAVAALSIPGVAAGAKPTGQGPASRATKPEVVESFDAPGTNGFTLKVSLVDRHRLVVGAVAPVGGHHGSQTAIYTLTVPRSADPDGIKARIGSLGRFDVRFVPGSTRETAPVLPGCSGGKTVVEEGHFVGQISFRGERGYTEVSARRVPGTITTEPARICKRSEPPVREEAGGGKETAGPEEEPHEVNLDVAVGHAGVAIEASRLQTTVRGRSRSFTSFTAVGVRHSGKIREVSLLLILFERGSTFVSPDPLHPTREATISPPAPFTGSATFRRESPGPVSWSGDLKVELPGFGEVPLTGDGARATMCEPPGCSG